MAHPYSSTPLYAGTPTYAPQQTFYSPYPSNGLQQSIPTPPGIPQQPLQTPGQSQTHPPYQPQPSPSTNGARFDANSQAHRPAPPFPPFPPPTFNSDFFKQFAGAGFPPPPLPNFPPVPLPNTGYPQLPASVIPSPSSPFPQYHPAGAQGFGQNLNQNEPLRQYAGDNSMGSQQDAWGSQKDTQTYGAPAMVQAGQSHAARPVARSAGTDKGRCATHEGVPILTWCRCIVAVFWLEIRS